MMKKTHLLTGTLLGVLLCAAPAMAQNQPSHPNPAPGVVTVNPNNNAAPNAANQAAPRAGVTVAPRATTGRANANVDQGDKKDVRNLVDEARREVAVMKKDPQMRRLMAKARGIFLVPEFGRGAFIVGGRGGAGLVMSKVNGKWSNPAFYDIGGISIGPQIGGSGGQVAFLLMSPDAVAAFKGGNKFSLNAGAGLSIVTYSANAQASWGKGDIILWSNIKGAYAGATVSVSDVNWDDDNNMAFYGRKMEPAAILGGKVGKQMAPKLQSALPG